MYIYLRRSCAHKANVLEKSRSPCSSLKSTLCIKCPPIYYFFPPCHPISLIVSPVTHLFDLGEPFFVTGQFGHEGLVLHPFPVQLLSFISSSIASCQHPIGLWELCSATPYTHMHRAVSRQLWHRHTLSQSFSHHFHTHTAPGPVHSTSMEHCSTTKNLFTCTASTHTHPKNVQRRGESSTSAECAAAVGSGAQGWGIHWVLMSSKLASRPLQFCCSIRASVQRLRKNNRYARTRKTDTHLKRLVSNRNLRWGCFL